MIKTGTAADTAAAMAYIGEDYRACLYLYADLWYCGPDNPNIRLWLCQRESRLTAVLLRYYDCIHLYSRDGDYDVSEVAALLREESASVISAPEQDILRLQEFFREDYYPEYMQIFTLSRLPENADLSGIRTADRETVARLADFLYQDRIYNEAYSLDTLRAQMLDRYDSGFCRYVCAMDGNRIVGCEMSNAETDKVGVLGGLMVSPEYGRRGWGKKLIYASFGMILGTGKTAYTYVAVNNSQSMLLHRKCGLLPCGMHGKLIRKSRLPL